MAEAEAQEKTEVPTQKKREDSRKEGMVASSREVSSAALLGAFALYFLVAGQSNMGTMKSVWRHSFTNLAAGDLTIADLGRVFKDVTMTLAPMLLGVFGLIFIVALLASYIQVGAVFNALKFQPNRLNPLNGIKRIFSSVGLAEFLKSLFKMGVIGYITYYSYQQETEGMLQLSRLSVEGILAFNASLLGVLFGRVALALVILAIFDYLFQRWNMEQRIKMTRQEVKDELKQTEGDPQLRARVRQVQRDVSRARMMQNVPKADVVVTNPTHYAVALMYDREVMTAPRLVAKGAGHIAQRIRDIAEENEVPIVENPPMAREIYAQVEIGNEIPEEFFKTVAEILAYVYRIKGQTAEPPLN
ncbi:MAG: flagellar biosynthesis protein FlhB [SAR324 cluster bacterium]|nr:flagellar biosynthesis protein FlhB [SAR324 cluster bacterium]